MGFWSGIKHALNSTLGTSKFKPLNELTDEMLASLIRLEASDELYTTIADTVTVTPQSGNWYRYTYPIQLKIHRQGSFKIVTENKSSGDERKFSIYVNGEPLYISTVNVVNFTVPVNAGDIITFDCYARYKTAVPVTIKVDTLKMYATPKLFNNFFEIGDNT